MKKIAFILFVLSLQAFGEDLVPKVGKERVVFHTIAGDIVFALYPEVAPKTVTQFLKLVRNGIYDGTHFYRVEPNFVIQTATAQDRPMPFTPEQTALIKKIDAEFEPRLKHRWGVLSMAREDADINSGETSFSILLGNAPHLDGKYTVFGHVEKGMEVIGEMLKVPRKTNLPAVRLTISGAKAFESSEALGKTPLRLPATIPIPEALSSKNNPELRWGVASGLIAMILLSLLAFFLKKRLTVSHLTSINLIHVLLCAFLLLIVLGPVAPLHFWLPPLLVPAIFGLFKLMNRFESY